MVTRTSSSSFWAFSPTNNRVAQAHAPWGGGDIYWDTAGCCDGGTQRINKAWTGDFAAWNHFAFVKNGDAKEIWVNGQLLHSGSNTGALPTDITRFAVGAMIDSAESQGGNSLEGSIDDFLVYAQGLTGAQIADLYYAGKELNLAITEQPQSATGVLGWDHTFSVGVSATQDGEPVSGGVDFQWSRNGEASDGANGSSYTTPGTLTADDSGSSYSVSISFTNKTVTSDEAVLTVAEDSTAPTVASASASKPPQSSEGGGAALEFKGGQYVSVPMDIPETDYTVEFWFRTEDPNAGLYCVVDQNLGAGGHDRHLHLIGGNIRIRTWSGDGIAISSGLNLADGKWHHLAHVLGADAEGQKIYIDGEVVIEQVKDFSNFDWQQHLNFGFSNDAASQYLVGEMDELRVWEVGRTEEEIKANMNKTLTGDEDWLFAYYRFDEVSGTVLPDLLEGYDGVLMGMGDRNWTISEAPLGQAPLEGFELPTTLNITFNDRIRNPDLGSGGSLMFDGRGASVALPDDIPQILSDGWAITVEYWFKGESFQSAVRWQDGQYFVAGWNGVHIISTDGGTGAGIAVGPATDGDWHHVAMTWEQDTVGGFRSYLDGELVAERDSGVNPLPVINGQAYLGAYQGVSEFTNGQLDEVRIWEVVRTEEELQEWMNKPLSGEEEGLLAYYQFDELSGDILEDISVNEFNGDLKNMTDANWSTGAGPAFTIEGPKGQAVPGTFEIEGAEIESLKYLSDGRSVRIIAYGIESKEAKVTINGVRDAGNNEIAADTMLVVTVEQEGGQAEPPVVTLEEGDGVIIINTSSGSLQAAPSVIGPWENVAAPLQLNLNELGAAGFFRAVN